MVWVSKTQPKHPQGQPSSGPFGRVTVFSIDIQEYLIFNSRFP